LESNALEIKIREPDGLDAEVIAWSNGSPLRIDVLREFPNSEYAAYAIYPYIRLDEADPKQVSSLIDQGKFPIASAVPDRDEGRTLSGADVARWRVEWGERIAREHPGFVFLDEVRVSAALARMSLGDRDKANRTLSDIAENGNRDTSNWVKAFLASRQEE